MIPVTNATPGSVQHYCRTGSISGKAGTAAFSWTAYLLETGVCTGAGNFIHRFAPALQICSGMCCQAAGKFISSSNTRTAIAASAALRCPAADCGRTPPPDVE